MLNRTPSCQVLGTTGCGNPGRTTERASDHCVRIVYLIIINITTPRCETHRHNIFLRSGFFLDGMQVNCITVQSGGSSAFIATLRPNF